MTAQQLEVTEKREQQKSRVKETMHRRVEKRIELRNGKDWRRVQQRREEQKRLEQSREEKSSEEKPKKRDVLSLCSRQKITWHVLGALGVDVFRGDLYLA